MNYFHQLEGENVILRSNGVFLQADLFTRGENRVLFAKYGRGYIRLLKDGGTSHPRVFWDEVSVPMASGKFGYQRLT